jgi:HAD superfamily hydrolase (TIGR01509 family)
MPDWKFSPEPGSDFDAYLYDCDGTLADTMEPHIEAWVQEIRSRGLDFDGSLIHELAGMPALQTVEVINQRYGVSLDPAEVAKAKEERFFSGFLHRIRPITPVCEDLISRARAGKKIAVVSGGRKRVVMNTLKIIGVADLVQVVICAEDVKIGKPHPEPFLLAAEKLGVSPDRCLVFEDAEFGYRSAIAAGMSLVKVER